MSAWIDARMANSLPFAAFAAGIMALLTTLALGPCCIRWLKSRFRERIASDSKQLNEFHAAKQNTPTMGGILIVGATILSFLSWADRSNPVVWVYSLTAAALLIVGSADDWIKQRTTRKGLTVRQKFVLQWMVSFAAAVGLWIIRTQSGHASGTVLPWSSRTVEIGVIWIPWAAFVLVGTTNAVNLTDGLDGLATGCTAIVACILAVAMACGTSIVADDASRHVAAIGASALAGSTLGFLWWNRHPAQVFMGDAGALPIGGMLSLTALTTGTELVLAIVGFVFVVETFSVFIQVAWYRRTRRRILLCSPLHNHFVFRGIAEQKIVRAFWLTAVIAGVIGLSSVC